MMYLQLNFKASTKLSVKNYQKINNFYFAKFFLMNCKESHYNKIITFMNYYVNVLEYYAYVHFHLVRFNPAFNKIFHYFIINNLYYNSKVDNFTYHTLDKKDIVLKLLIKILLK